MPRARSSGGRLGAILLLVSCGCVLLLVMFVRSPSGGTRLPPAEKVFFSKDMHLHPKKREKEDTTHLTKSKSVMADNVLRVDTEPHIVANSSMVISKNSFSSKFRLIFLVGLEGTGHHYMADVLDRLCKISMIPCPNVCKMGKALYPGLGAPESANSYLAARRQLRQEMEYLANTANRMEEGKATMVGFGKCRNDMVGMMSYPNFNGIAKSVQYVDFRILAEEAERAGVDLRIIYLSRPARDVIVSDTKHNNYGETFMMESRALLANADVLVSTFRELGPGFVTCFYYDHITSEEQAERVADFVAPTEQLAHRFATRMVKSVRRPRRRQWSDKVDPYKDLWPSDSAKGLLVARLQQKLNAIERDQCDLL